MESLTRLVTDSLARHGFDRPIDPHQLEWSRWFRCESSHSLLIVPSKPGIFALAEEIGGVARAPSPASLSSEQMPDAAMSRATLQRSDPQRTPALSGQPKRMLAVLQFCEDDDMAFVLDRMFTHINPMRSRLSSGNCFLRFVAIADQDQRRNTCAALNQWLASSAEKASGIPVAFSSSLELNLTGAANLAATTGLDSGASKNLHCSHPLPSGF